MHTRFGRIGVTVLALLAGGVAGAAGLPHPSAGFRGCPMVADHTLRQMRGGFSVPFGPRTLNVAFAIRRVTYINGQLKAITQLTIPALGPVIATRPTTPNIPSISLPAVATTPPAPPRLPVPPTPGSPTSSVATLPSPAPGSSTPSTSTPPVTSVPAVTGDPQATRRAATRSPASVSPPPSTVVKVDGPITTVQNGPGNTSNLLALPNLSRQSLTVIQNTLNNQRIRNATVIDTTVRNMALYKALRLSSQIGQGIANSLR